MRLNHNSASLNVYTTYSKSLKDQSVALGRISSGYKVNNAKDSPNGIADSERIRMQIRGLQAASKNSQDGISMLQTAESGLDNMGSIIQRVRELVIQSGSANTPQDRQIMQNEIDQMIDGMDNISNNTEFNGNKLLSQEKDLEMVVGANVGENIIIPQKDLTSNNLKTLDGKSLSQLKSGELYNITDGNHINDALNILDESLNSILSVRSQYGALENRFQESFSDATEISDKLESADSGIRDADVAEEMINYTKSSILVQAGNAMMVQTNKLPQDALRILENVRSR
ncbi:flagellin [Clostridium sp. JS66]|uniref:flagellin N-terminal helical domain-containing protein n=1 Tax=Clostridium sp. JS66 TaxID=3064705 RepID=UPI00298E664B|nr:flagellin [Clostridium sp. JS66]WPC41006.1 flagellin [Clostridium sp. JS66]